MPYKDKEAQKEAVKKAVNKHRVLQKGITSEGITGQGITKYPAILEAIVDPEKRKKLEKITLSLKEHKVAELVRYGCYGPTFDVVGDLLEVTK